MQELVLLLVGGAVALITQFVKKYVPFLNPLVVVAGVAIVIGVGYSYIETAGILTPTLIAVFTKGFAYAVSIYQVIKEVLAKDK